MLVMTFIFDYYYYHSNFLFGDFKVFGFYVITFKVLGLCQAHMWLIKYWASILLHHYWAQQTELDWVNI